MKAEDLCEIFRTRGIASEPYASIDAALDALKELRGDAGSDMLPILCFGSLYSAGDIRRACGIYNETAE
jgi:folylpolyglutamate synthase/dihydropteroate synthase